MYLRIYVYEIETETYYQREKYVRSYSFSVVHTVHANLKEHMNP